MPWSTPRRPTASGRCSSPGDGDAPLLCGRWMSHASGFKRETICCFRMKPSVNGFRDAALMIARREGVWRHQPTCAIDIEGTHDSTRAVPRTGGGFEFPAHRSPIGFHGLRAGWYSQRRCFGPACRGSVPEVLGSRGHIERRNAGCSSHGKRHPASAKEPRGRSPPRSAGRRFRLAIGSRVRHRRK